MKGITTKLIGDKGEAQAAKFLQENNLIVIGKNFSSKFGELDLVCQDQEVYVFVEVKYRQSSQFGGAISTISKKKQQKLKLCASFYFQQLGLNEYNTPCRFDVVALQGSLDKPQITWLKNAF
ncbi:YraN family protein [Thalassotalea sp. M1531]|uniref:UPF0102 protein HII17_01575 n=1 Tax=Thalassotalea algicola TaxID=2716224 RepID=A0A7Y0LA06_9GAMM|nr:YraN family protein [Thalassotalea algicola]